MDMVAGPERRRGSCLAGFATTAVLKRAVTAGGVIRAGICGGVNGTLIPHIPEVNEGERIRVRPRDRVAIWRSDVYPSTG